MPSFSLNLQFMFNIDEKELLSKGFIDKNRILRYVTEEQIFKLVFGFEPKEYDYVTSPFRNDKNPGCWFAYGVKSGKLKFYDFGSEIYINKRHMTNIDCFDAVQIYFKLGNLYNTLNFIRTNLIDGKQLPELETMVIQKREKTDVIINFNARNFNDFDKRFWSPYEISSTQLIEDKVFAVSSFEMLNTKKGDFSNKAYGLCYAYTDFQGGRKKLYRPYDKIKKFLTNCNQNDIGGINVLPEHGRDLLITKAYKDWRVTKNQGCTGVYFQNEGMIPDDEYLIPLIKRFDRVKIWYDNDETGMKASLKLSKHINNFFPGKSQTVSLHESLLKQSIKDPSDLIAKKNQTELIQFIYKNNLL